MNKGFKFLASYQSCVFYPAKLSIRNRWFRLENISRFNLPCKPKNFSWQILGFLLILSNQFLGGCTRQNTEEVNISYATRNCRISSRSDYQKYRPNKLIYLSLMPMDFSFSSWLRRQSPAILCRIRKKEHGFMGLGDKSLSHKPKNLGKIW